MPILEWARNSPNGEQNSAHSSTNSSTQTCQTCSVLNHLHREGIDCGVGAGIEVGVERAVWVRPPNAVSYAHAVVSASPEGRETSPDQNLPIRLHSQSQRSASAPVSKRSTGDWPDPGVGPSRNSDNMTNDNPWRVTQPA